MSTSAIASNRKQEAHFRLDIEGLRAVAVGLVVVFHAGISAFQGGFVGVDVFFVLSGYLITGVLLRGFESPNAMSFANFYARRARRLLTLAAVTIIATVIASRFIMSPFDLAALRGDAFSGAFYFSNWHFAAANTDYMNAEATASPLLHFWSLSIEEQFYLAWPALLLIFASARGIGARLAPKLSVRMRAAVLSGIVVATSFTASIVLTRSQGPLAYYGLHTRGFELGAGALLACIGTAWFATVRVRVASGIGWIGAALIVIPAVTFSRDTVFPGAAAAIPVVGTLLVLAAGFGVTPTALQRFLGTRPLRYVGRISYAWYLTHWPVLILVAYATTDGNGQQATWPWTLTAVAGSFCLAGALHVLIENPVRYSTWLTSNARRSITAGLAISVLATGVGIAASATDVPALAISRQRDTPCNLVHDETKLATCILGDPSGTRTIAFFGDSHAAMWTAAFDQLGRDRHWKVLQLTKEGCIFAELSVTHALHPNEPYRQCNSWRQDAFRYLDGHPVDLLVSIRSSKTYERIWGTTKRLDPEAAETAYAQGFRRSLARTQDSASKVVVLQDTPRSPHNIPRCVAERLDPLDACDFSPGELRLDAALLAAEHSQSDERVAFADVREAVCPHSNCPARMDDGTVNYWDTNHFTDGYSKSLSTALGRALDTAVPKVAFVVPIRE